MGWSTRVKLRNSHRQHTRAILMSCVVFWFVLVNVS